MRSDLLDPIRDLISSAQNRVDDLLWDDPHDPRIEHLEAEIKYLKAQEKKGEHYEPRF